MRKLSVIFCVLAGLALTISAGCKKEPCEAALGNMKKIAESMPDKGGKAPTAEEEKEFLAGCAK